MKAPIRIFLFFFALLSFSLSGNIYAQWKEIAPNLVSNYFPPFLANADLGAIHFKDGVLWAGWRDLWFSNDTGKTWKQSNIVLPKDHIISDINFFDKLNGIISTEFQANPPTSAGILLKTVDGGLSWKRILTIPSSIPNIAYSGSASIIHAISEGGDFFTSIDGGTSWKNTRPGVNFGLCFAIAKDNRIYTLTAAYDPSGLLGTISFSTDRGISWNKTSGTPDGDSYTICADSCDPKRLNIASEDYLSTIAPLNLSQLFYSIDAGNSFVSSVAFPAPYLSGGMTCTANTIYTSSIKNGIYRSIDRGVTWKNLGGPLSMAVDGRNIACVNDNIVFVLDADGSIWETINSGGDSLTNLGINDLALLQNSLFSKDSLFVCDNTISIIQSVILQPKGCSPPTLVKIEVLGSDSLSYTATQITGDSISVIFSPLYNNLNSAQLILTLSDGSKRIVTLMGYGIPPTPLTITTTANQNVDTLGALVTIPIMINGLRKPENITLVMHYDTVLNYNGSLSNTGVKLDLPNEQWKGRTKLSIPNATSNKILGFAHFDVFNDSVAVQKVSFDSLTVLSTLAACQYIYYPSPEAAASIVTPLSGCGVLTISRYLHHNQVPQVRITPNPTTGDVLITSSLNLGECSITVYDILGTEKGRQSLTLAKNSPAKILLSVGNGVYAVRIKSEIGSYDLRVVVNK